MNLNNLAKEITLQEGGKINLPIGQVKEVMRIVLQELAKMSETESRRVINRYKWDWK